MTDLDRIIAACEIAKKAATRRKAQMFTAEEEPIILQALATMPSLLVSLLANGTGHADNGLFDSTGTTG